MEKRSENWSLRLYVSSSSVGQAAVENLRRTCDEFIPGRYNLEVIDVVGDPEAAERDGIVAVPTLVRSEPAPKRKIIGDMRDRRMVATALGISLPFE